MKILINKETGIPMFPLDQLLMDPQCKACYDMFGIHGLHYAILFGWDGSPYKTKTDKESRHALVYDAVKNLDLYDTMKNKMIFSKNSKITPAVQINPVVDKAINVINTLARIPILEMRNYLLTQIDATKKSAEKIKYKDGGDAGDAKKTADTKRVLMDQILTMQKSVDDLDVKIEAMYKQEKHVDLYDLIKAVE